MGAAQQLKRIFNEGFNATTPTDAASTTGSVAAMVKALVAQIIGTTNTSAVTADAAGSIVERIQYITDNTGIGLKKVSSSGYTSLPAPLSSPVSVTAGAGAYTYGTYAEMRSASGNAIYIVGYTYRSIGNTAEAPVLAIGTGGAGSETLVSQLPLVAESATNVRIVMLPATGYIAVAANTRIAAKIATSAGSDGTYLRLLTIDQANVVPA